MGHFCPSSPLDLPKCQTIITVRVCVKVSRAEGLSVFLKRRRRPKAGDAFTRTQLVPTFGLKVHRWVLRVFRVFRVFMRFQGLVFLGFGCLGLWGDLGGLGRGCGF